MSTDEHLERLVERVAPDLLAYFERRVVDREDAADLLGETLLVAWRRADTVPREDERGRMWLFGVARRVLGNHARGVRRRLALADALREDVARAATHLPSRRGAVRDAVDALPAHLGELVRLVHWDGFSLTEAAELTGTSASTVRSRYARARQLLQRSLSPPEPQPTVPSGQRTTS